MTYGRCIAMLDGVGGRRTALTRVLSLSTELGLEGGCLGGSMALPGGVADPYDLRPGELIDVRWSEADDPTWLGEVVSRSVSADGRTHEYQLAGLVRRLDRVRLDWQRLHPGATGGDGDLKHDWTIGSTPPTGSGQTAPDYQVSTIGAAVSYIAAALDVAGQAGLATGGTITCNEPMACSMAVRSDGRLGELLGQLAALADGNADGRRYAWGVDAAGKLFFHEVSATPAVTLTWGVDLLGGQRSETYDEAALLAVTVLGARMRTRRGGYCDARRSFRRTDTGGRGGVRVTAARALARETDLRRMAAGLMARRPPGQDAMTGIAGMALAGPPPLPWAGRVAVVWDGETVSAPAERVSVEWGAACRWTADHAEPPSLEVEGRRPSLTRGAHHDPGGPEASLDGWGLNTATPPALAIEAGVEPPSAESIVPTAATNTILVVPVGWAVSGG